MERETTTIINKAPVSPVTALVGLLAAVSGVFGIKYWMNQAEKNAAEKETSTEAGQIAVQFKTLFADSSNVSDVDFRKINVQVNASNKEDVYRIFKGLTTKNLSDEIAQKVSTGAVKASQKIEVYNSKTGGLFTIDKDEKIKFEVGAGQFIHFATGQTSPVWVYANPLGIAIYNQGNPALISYFLKHKEPKVVALAVRVSMPPSAKIYKVAGVQAVPINGAKPREGWTSAIVPYVKTSQTFAVIQIGASAYIDARDMVKYNPSIKGLTDIGSLLL